jgi:hypothetical protein
MGVTRFHAELATALATAALGGVAIIGTGELGWGWGETGPEPGYFPFYVGLVLIGASLWNLWRAFSRYRVQPGATVEPFLRREHLVRLGTFVAAMAGFVIGTLTLGVYVAASGYVGWSAWRQGGYRLWVALATGIAFSAALFAIFETIFKIPLLKGPLEALLGIY